MSGQLPDVSRAVTNSCTNYAYRANLYNPKANFGGCDSSATLILEPQPNANHYLSIVKGDPISQVRSRIGLTFHDILDVEQALTRLRWLRCLMT